MNLPPTAGLARRLAYGNRLDIIIDLLLEEIRLYLMKCLVLITSHYHN